MRSVTKTLAFPLSGVSRRGAHRQQAAPFTSPWAVNVRTNGPGDARRRGGSRPGLTKLCETDLGGVTALFPVTYIDSGGTHRHDLVYVADGALGYVRDGVAVSTTAELEGPDGVDILDDDGETIDFSATVTDAALHGVVRNGSIYFADSVLRRYSPATGVVEPVVASAGIVPTAEPVIALYRDRIFLAGTSNAWFASRVGDPTDWNYGAAMEDPGAAVAGQLSGAGQTGRVVTAMVAVSDQALVMATANTLWVLRGDPAGGGRLQNVSDEIGIVDRDAWAVSPDGLLAFLSNDGVYLWNPAGQEPPARFSAERVPDELREVDPDDFTISMCYDPLERGFHLFLSPVDGVTAGTHWWIDVANRAFWPQRLAVSQQPLDAAHLSGTDLGSVVIASRDGYLRQFDTDAADDDGLDLESHVLIGPVRIAADDVRDGLLAEIHGAIEGLSEDNSVTWRVVTGRSAADAVEDALADLDDVLDGLEPTGVAAQGAWLEEGMARVQRPRCRGPWVVVWLSSAGAWSYETVALVARQLGRHR